MTHDVVNETLTFEAVVDAPVATVWALFADADRRAEWGAPEGESQVYDQAQFRVGGRDRYRCGPPDTLDFRGVVDYLVVEPGECLVHTDIVSTGDVLLAASLQTWRFTDLGDRTGVSLTDQVTSFVGAGMIDGHRNGNTKALAQLVAYVGELG